MTSANTLGSQLSELVIQFPAEEIPEDVVELAKFCLIDAVGCTIHGRSMPWTRMLERHQIGISKAGGCKLLVGDVGLSSQIAAMLWGASCHAFELDNLRRPGAGVHPGACIAMPALAVALENGNSGRELLEAIALAIEGMFRIGLAAQHSSEKLGFHAPGITGPFGSALACSRLLGLSAEQTSLALGLCGSFAGGILEFSQSNQGGMVKRIHMGRAAESGVLAARLAQLGYEGPHSVLEGTFGILKVFCKTNDPGEVLREFGTRWQSRTMCFKKYPSHITTQAILQFLQAHGFPDAEKANQIQEITLHVPHKVISHHSSRSPRDVMGMQYSVPFMTAAACVVDVSDPASVNEQLIDHHLVTQLVNRIRLVEIEEGSKESWDAKVEIDFDDSSLRLFGSQVGFPGSPVAPFALEDLRDKFMKVGILGHPVRADLDRLFSKLATLEREAIVRL